MARDDDSAKRYLERLRDTCRGAQARSPLVRAEPPHGNKPPEVWYRLAVGRRWWKAGEALDDVDPVTLDAYERAHREHAPKPARAVLTAADRKRVVLLGETGAGKSALARDLAYAVADGAGLAGFLPLLVDPYRFDEGRGTAALLDAAVCTPPAPVVDAYLRRGQRVVLIVDGVADVPGRAALLWTVARWAERFPAARVVVTSRLDGYDRRPLDRAGFHHYRIEAPDRSAAPVMSADSGLPMRVARSIGQQCDGELVNRVVDPVLAAEVAGSVRAGDDGTWRVLADGGWRFAERAVLERLVAADLAHRPTGNRVGAVVNRYWREPTWQAVLPLLAGMLDVDAAGALVRRLVAVDPVWQLRPDAPPRHVMLAARCLAGMRDPGTGASAMAGALTAALNTVEDGPLLAEFVDAVRPALVRHPRIAARLRDWCVSGDATASAVRIALLLLGPHPDLVRSVRARVWRDDITPLDRSGLVAGLVGVDDGDAVSWLTELAGHRDIMLRAAAVSALAGAPGAGPLLAERALGDAASAVRLAAVPGIRDLPLLHRIAANDTDEDVRRTAVHAVAELAPTDPATRILLVDRATADTATAVRVATIEALLFGWRHDPDTTSLLSHLIDDARPEVRAAAVRALDDAPEALPRLRDLADDPSWPVRVAALRALGAYWPNEPGVTELLATHAAEDPSGTVRQAAVHGLANRLDDPATLARMTGWAADDDWAVRRAATLTLAGHVPADGAALLRGYAEDGPDEHAYLAVSALAAGWPREPAAVAVLRRVAEDGFHHTRLAALAALAADPEHAADARAWWYGLLTHEDAPAREAATRHLADRWPDHPDTLPALLTRANAESEPGLRTLAVRLVGARWPGHPDVAAVLRGRGRADREREVRAAALAGLAAGWADDPDAVDLVRTCAADDAEMLVRRAAAEALVSTRRDDPATVELLRDRAATDPDQILRGQLLDLAVGSWPDAATTVPWLLRLAGAAEHDDVRRRATRILRDRWPDRPGVADFLGRRAVAEPDPTVRADAVGALRGAGTHRLVTDRAVHDDAPAVRAAAVAALANHGAEPGSLATVRDRAVHDEDDAVRAGALASLVAAWPDDPDTLPLVRDRLGADPAGAVRSAAAQWLAERWPDDPGTRPLLYDAARRESDTQARWSTVWAVLSRWRTDPDTVGLLRHCALAEEDHGPQLRLVRLLAELSNADTLAWLRACATADRPAVRLASVRPLRALWPEHPDTPAILLGLAADPHPLVRRAAVAELSHDDRDDPDVCTVLRGRADDPDPSVRAVAVQALRRYTDDPGVAELLYERATTDDDDTVRWGAVVALGEEHWPDRPEVVAWLREHAANDPDDHVRFRALTTLAERWSGDAATVLLLREVAAGGPTQVLRRTAIGGLRADGDATTTLLARLARTDEDPGIRRATLAALTDEWSLDPDTLALVRERAVHDPDGDVRWTALSALVRRDEPGTTELLRRCAVADRDPDNRAHLLTELADRARDEIETADLLADRAHHDTDPEVRAVAEEALTSLGQPPRVRCDCHLH
ncbi:MAG TPA: HEAT repeat domain-containing protein [Actinocatenispora sp.]